MWNNSLAVPRAPAPDSVAIRSLTLTDFRNFWSLSVALDVQTVVLTGPNGAGKTNFLEAISLLTPGRGLRRAAFEEIVRTGAAGGWAVAALIARNGAETRIGTGLVDGAPGEPRVRKVRVNGAPAASADDLLEYLRVLWLTPAMDGLFTGPASERRRFLDRLVLTLDPGHGRRARDFERLLTQRNRLLAEGNDGGWLDALEAELAACAVALALARAETVGLISTRMSEPAPEAAGFPRGRIAIAGEFDRAIFGRTAAEAEIWYRDTLRAQRPADRMAGRTLEGPHRSDLEVVFAEKDMPAALSSTGEQKALLVGLILAHADIIAKISGMTPVLLLDEVAAHLDPVRRAALFARVAALGGQAFMTGTDAGLFDRLPGVAAHFCVTDGELVSL